MEDHAADVAVIAGIDAVPTILVVLCQTTGMGFAAIARVTEHRWVACGVRDEIGFGLQPGGELQVQTTICQEVRGHREPVIIENVAEDDAFCYHPTPSMYGFQSYLSMPIVLPDGTFFGTLCAIDPMPRVLKSPGLLGTFRLFADLVAFQIDAHRKVTESAARLLDERAGSELREQFIAVLGHDLRNPVASIGAGVQLLEKEALTERGRRVIGLLARSVDRMTGLIEDVLDLARGRLGGGIQIEAVPEVSLAPMLRQVVDELRGSRPDRLIETDFSQLGILRCDPGRIGQLASNLVANALTHGAADTPVLVRAGTVEGRFEISVSNGGEPIAQDTLEHLFKPFVRASARPNQQGLGLGLYIASEIAKAHGGTLDATSTPQETRFTFGMPAG